MKEPSVTVGIMSGETIGFVLNGTYLQGGHPVEGAQTARIEQGHIGWNGGLYDQLLFTPLSAHEKRKRRQTREYRTASPWTKNTAMSMRTVKTSLGLGSKAL